MVKRELTSLLFKEPKQKIQDYYMTMDTPYHRREAIMSPY